jgi:hypothetical protein
MTQDDLRTLIKQIVKDKYFKQLKLQSGTKTNALGNLPDVNEILVLLMTENYRIFVIDIEWVAPKPTTFRITLGNNEQFFLEHTKKSWIAQIEGKKYYLLRLNERQDAINAIARSLRYGKPKTGEELQTELPPTPGPPPEAPPTPQAPEGASPTELIPDEVPA